MINKVKNTIALKNEELTGRETEVLGLIIAGCTNKQIAAKLLIGLETVRTHRKHILKKTATKNTAALINHYYQNLAGKKSF